MSENLENNQVEQTQKQVPEPMIPQASPITSYMGEEKLLKMLPDLEEFKTISYWLAHRLWSEANAGNMSLRLDEFSEKFRDVTLEPIHTGPLGREYPELDGILIAITGTTKRMRNTAFKLKGNIGIIRIVEHGTAYETIWGSHIPTSELPAHLGIHQYLVQHKPNLRGIVHTHPTKTIALTHLVSLQDSKAFNTTLYKLHPETWILIPEGICYLNYDIPGSLSLGERTARSLEQSSLIVWANHGVVAVGENLGKAFDRIEVIEKAAEIYWQLRAMGEWPAGIGDKDIERTKEAFGLPKTPGEEKQRSHFAPSQNDKDK